ncbi:MAG: RHS repeat-associated core domain-containing protein, partial [Gemmatimonadales bacterium]|nr:RHS repeat-associated core domain-containing protein [Gemmatimonadales bacterium]
NRALADSTGYAYDGAGRLRRVTWQSGDSVVYRYTQAGDLDTMRVYWRTSGAPKSETWRFTWDGLGRRRIIHYPFNQMTVQYSYDRLGTLRRVLSSNPGSEFFSDRFDFTMRQDSVDVLGRPLNQRIACSGNPGVAWPCGDWLPNNTSNRYNRLGALVIQERIAAGVARDTMRYDQSGNQIQRWNGITGEVTAMIYPALSNRLDTLRVGGAETLYDYDQAGNRIFQVKPSSEQTAWQYDGLSRLVGSASVSNIQPVLTHFNACRWDAAWRLAQPCGNGGQLALMGLNVTRSSLGWFFVHAPGIDEALLLIDRTDNFFVNKRLQAVTDGRGQLIAIADSAGFITEAYAGSGHDQSSWQGAGLTTQAQTFDPRKWQTNDQWGGIQQFRNRAYDPATGTWIQEDPMGVAGGVNVYRFNNGNPVSFGDPLGLLADTLVVEPEARKDVQRCRKRSAICDADFNQMEQSTVVFRVEKLSKEEPFLNPNCVSGCTSSTVDNNKVAVQYRPSDFNGSQKRIGVKVDAQVVIGHEAGHAVTVTPTGTTCTDFNGCAKANENRIRKQFGPQYGQRP